MEKQQNADVQKPDVQAVAGVVVTLASVRAEANESGKTGTPNVNIETFRQAFADASRADSNATGKAAVCADLFKPLRTAEEVGVATRHALFGYIHGRAGKEEAEKWFAMKNNSQHPLYKMASNAVKRAKKRAEREGWEVPMAANAGQGAGRRRAQATKPGAGSELIAALAARIAVDPDFTTEVGS